MSIPFLKGHHFHFIGIGGIGMSSIAEILYTLGCPVKGSDLKENANTQRLQDLGIEIFIGHSPNHIHNAQIVVVSSDVPSGNIEVLTGQKQGIPVLKRAEMLAEIIKLKRSIAVSGTHGKTTTTSLMAALLDEAALDPLVINGGVMNAYGTNARFGKGEWAVVEADESDGSFTLLCPTLAVVTNIDAEHLSFYGTTDNLHRAFLGFLNTIPFYGLAVLCGDHPTVMSLLPSLRNRRFLTYGLTHKAMVKGVNLRQSCEGTTFDVDIDRSGSLHPRLFTKGNHEKPLKYSLKDLFLPMMGLHNVQNCLSAIAVADELGIKDEILYQALKGFKGVKRRFTVVGTVKGITIIDDYAHHPVEIETVIKAAKQATKGRIWVVMQPHRYTRLRDLFDEFVDCVRGVFQVILTPVYAANEDPISGVNSEVLSQALSSKNIHNRFVSDFKGLVALLNQDTQTGDLILCLGAGDITIWASDLVHHLS